MRAIPVSLPKFVVLVAALTILAVAFAVPVRAQEASADQAAVSFARPLITAPVDEAQLTTLKGNTHPLARREFDLGAAPASLPLQRMLLVLKRSPDQEHALRTLLDNQQDKGSPSYHKWLTPEDFGRQFGPTDADMQAITGWLQSHGFQVAAPSKGRTVLEFSGSASQVQEAFHTSIHKFVVNGEQHWANATDPKIPTALTPAVAGVLTMHNFLKKPNYVRPDQKFFFTHEAGKPPQFTNGGGQHALVPGDYAVIYNINPVYQAGIDGAGTTIAVVARSQILAQDVADFRSAVGLSVNPVNLILNGPDPGDVQGDDFEGTLDATWSGAVAPGATIDFVISASTFTSDGVDLSVFYIIENNLGNVMTQSFGGCEANATQAQANGLAALAEQASAQGISYMNSTGDAGAEGCDNPNFGTVATGPVSADLPATTPFVTAVGGTIFNEGGNDSTYWHTQNDVNFASAIKYIPEDVWNESCAAATCGANANIAAGGGGASVFFAKPSWQAALTGAGDGARDIPDVSLTAAGHDLYLICFQQSCPQGFFAPAAGTSASAPSFAGIMALVDQKMGLVLGTPAGARQGLANYILYTLAAGETFSQCNGSTGQLAATCVFNDVTVGNNAVPDTMFTSTLYPAGTGYDLATGLGSVNVNNLVNKWATATFRPTTTTLALGPTTTHGLPVTVNISVARSNGTTGTPTGDVSLLTSVGGANGGSAAVDGFTLTSSGTFSGTTTQLPGGGPYAVTAHYAGNSTSTATGIFAPSDSNTVMVTISPEASTTTIDTAQTFTLSGNQLNFVPLGSGTGYGNLVYLGATVAGASGNGIPTGSINFADANGDPPIPGNPYPLNSEGSATTAQGLFTLPAGQYSVTANYSHDASFNASNSAPLVFTISKAATSSTVTPSASSISPGGSVTLTASIATGTATVPSFGAAPTGTVSFFANGTLVGTAQPVVGTAGVANIFAAQLSPSSATASLTTTALPTGSNTITATYTGDANYATSTSAGITVNVQPDFTLPVGGLGTVVVTAPGGMGTVNLSLTPGTGFNSAVTFTCVSSTLPAETTCTQGTIAAGATSGTMTVQTTGPHTVMLQPNQRQNYYALWVFGGGFAFGGVFLVGGSRRRRWMVLMSLIVLALLVVLPACGGGGGGGGSHQDPGTPVGQTTVTVTAAVAGGPSHNTTFLLNVQ